MSDLSEKVVLFVEDDDADVELTTRAFESLGFDARVEHASDGHAALQRLRAGLRPDLILTDLKMPKINGLELARVLHADPQLASIPVVFLTSSAERRDREEALTLGAKAFVTKPMQLADFAPIVAVLRAQLTA